MNARKTVEIKRFFNLLCPDHTQLKQGVNEKRGFMDTRCGVVEVEPSSVESGGVSRQYHRDCSKPTPHPALSPSEGERGKTAGGRTPGLSPQPSLHSMERGGKRHAWWYCRDAR